MCREAGTGEVMSIFRLEDTRFYFWRVFYRYIMLSLIQHHRLIPMSHRRQNLFQQILFSNFKA